MGKILILEVPQKFPFDYQITLPFYRRNAFKVRVKEGVIRPGMKLKINEKIIEIESIEAESHVLQGEYFGDFYNFISVLYNLILNWYIMAQIINKVVFTNFNTYF